MVLLGNTPRQILDSAASARHNCSMSVLFRCRVDPKILSKADRVTESLGTSTAEMVRVFLTEIARTGEVPVSLKSHTNGDIVVPWEQRAKTLESFYDPSKTW